MKPVNKRSHPRSIKGVLGISFLIISILAIVVFLFSYFIQPILPPDTNYVVLLIVASIVGTMSVLAALNEIIELFEKLFGYREKGYFDKTNAHSKDGELEVHNEKIRKEIFNKLCDYHKADKDVNIGQVINWFKHKYTEESIKEELRKMERENIIQLDNSDPIGPATGITLLINHY